MSGATSASVSRFDEVIMSTSTGGDNVESHCFIIVSGRLTCNRVCLCRTLSLMACALVAGASLSGVATLMLLIISTSTGYWIKKKETANEGLWIYCTGQTCKATECGRLILEDMQCNFILKI